MYEYLVEKLISYNQVDSNLRRTADRGLVSELYRRQMNALALKYFGIDSNGNYTDNKEEIVAYRCPYSGKIISDLSNAHLEHILPVSSGGGTVLFNCIPILDKVNLSKLDEPNLLAWWQEQDYFKYDRLERLVQYMLEAYTLVFKEPSEEELYDDGLSNSSDYIENDDLSIDLKSKSIRINNSNQNITYYQLLFDMINELSKNRDVSKYSTELNNLKEQNVFGNIDEIEKVIKVVQNLFKEVLGNNSKKYLSYSLKIDMNKLLKSLKTKYYENEIRERLSFINKLVKENNKEINDYFESLQDIEECNLFYYNNPTDEQITAFINNIKVSHATKIKIFIDMLADKKYTSYVNALPDSNNIFSSRNKISFEGYEHIEGLNTSKLWINNSNKIIKILLTQKQEIESRENRTASEEQKLKKLNIALRAIDDYKFVNKNNTKRRIEKFIDMLSESKYTGYVNGFPDSNNIFSSRNKIPFEGYEHIEGLNTSKFWINNSNKIIKILLTQKQEIESKENRTTSEEQKLKKLNISLKAIDDFNFVNKNNLERRIEKFIDMLSDNKYTSYVNGLPDSNNIFSAINKIPFEGYEHIEGLSTSNFWIYNSNQIIETINTLKKGLESKENRTTSEEQKLKKLNIALKAIDDFDFANKNNPKRRIEIFIDMLSESKYTSYVNGIPDSNNIFPAKNEIPFEGYEHIEGLNTSHFYIRNSNQIIETINTLKKGLESKENRTTSEEQKLKKLNIALRAIDDYNFVNNNNPKRRIEIFIDMLSESKYTSYVNGFPDSNNIFSAKNEIPFEGYEHIENLSTIQFWSNNSKDYIIPMLFYNKVYDKRVKTYVDSDLDYTSSKYDSARNAVMEFLNYCRRRKKQPEFKSIDEYIDTLDKTKKEVKALIELRDSLISRKEQLLVENQELKKQLNTSVRRAM